MNISGKSQINWNELNIMYSILLFDKQEPALYIHGGLPPQNQYQVMPLRVDERLSYLRSLSSALLTAMWKL